MTETETGQTGQAGQTGHANEAGLAGQAEEAAQAGVWATLGALPRAAVLLMVGVAVNRMGSFVQIYLVLYLVQGGLSPSAAGTVLTGYGAGALCGVFASGAITDRLGFRWTIAGSMLLSGVQVGSLPFVHGFAALLPLCFGAGLCAQAYFPAASSMLASVTPPQRLVMVSALYRLALNVGAMIGPLIGALLAATSYRLVFLTDMGTSVAFAAVALAWLPRHTAPAGARRSQGSSVGYSAVFKDRRYMLVVGALVFMAAIEIQYLVTLPLQMRAWGLSTTLYSILVAANALLVIMLELPLTRFVQTWPLRRAIVGGVALITLGIVLYGVRGGIAMLAIGTVIRTLGEISAAPSLTAYPAIVAPEAARSRYIATMGAAQNIGYAVGPALGAGLFEFAHWLPWTVFAGLGVIAIALALSGVRPRPTSEAAAVAG
jgi:MFS family permease